MEKKNAFIKINKMNDDANIKTLNKRDICYMEMMLKFMSLLFLLSKEKSAFELRFSPEVTVLR